jgi:hypothetical protein
VQLKNGAQADLLAGDAGSQADPALAEWQVGSGRVVAWTPGLDSDWAGGWLGEKALWNDAVRWSDRATAPPPLTPHALGGASSSLQIDLAGAGTAAPGVSAIDGTLTNTTDTIDTSAKAGAGSTSASATHAIAFAPVGPSLYEADVSSLPAGIYRFALRTLGTVRDSATGELAIGYPAEYSPVSAQVSPLAQLVAQTGGRILAADAPAALESHELSLWRILALAALAVFLVGVAGRMLGRGQPRAAARKPRAAARKPRAAIEAHRFSRV